jgi:hypothetical protein
MARELLTVKQLESYKGDFVLRDGNGLMLRGSRWVLQVRAHGKRHDLGLGGWPEVGLKQARQKAEAARERARRGGVPQAGVTGTWPTSGRPRWWSSCTRAPRHSSWVQVELQGLGGRGQGAR